MKARPPAASAILFALAGTFTLTQTVARAIPMHGGAQAHKSALAASGSPPQATQELQALHTKCLKAGKRVQRDVLTMEPGRAWRWRLDSERSRKQLGGLRQDLKDSWDAEAALEASLPATKRSRLNSQFVLIHKLFEHLERDAQSLDTELKKGYPTR